VFAIALKADQPPTYVLSDTDTGSRLEIVPDRGGLATRWQVENQEIFTSMPNGLPTLNYRCGGAFPFCFPSVAICPTTSTSRW
jgi:galactose mutarotase-like enzyme